MKMLSGTTYFPTFAMVMLAASLTLVALTSKASAAIDAPPLPSFDPENPFDLPVCLSKVSDCMKEYMAKNVGLTAVADTTREPKPICCPEWAEIIDNDTKCWCNSLASTAVAVNKTQTDEGLKRCNIDGTFDSLCTEKEAASGASTKWAGPISGLMLLLAGLFLY